MRCFARLTELRMLNECHSSRKSLPSDGIEPTKLYCTNRNVDDENRKRLAAIQSPAVAYRSSDRVKDRVRGGVTREGKRLGES